MPGGRDAIGVEGRGMGRGYPPPQPTRDLVELRQLSGGVRAEPRPKTILVVFKPAQNTSRCSLCCKLASRQQTSVGAKSWLTVENFISK